ncbi:MAG: glutamate--tRNA ligase [Chloroflexota bacterium]
MTSPTQSLKPVRVRFAPSPTGRLHLGGARTALYNYLLARQTGGQFILRLEDTDRKRYQPETEKEIVDGLHWLGIDWDEGFDRGGPFGPYRQSERKDIYLEYAHQLIDSGHAYFCFCSPERLQTLRQAQLEKKQQIHYDGTCRDIPLEKSRARAAAGERHVIRFKMPREGSIKVKDALREEIIIDNRTLDDSILVKSDGLALYHLAVVVDDHLMKITHVFRGSEWLSTFPLHGHIYQAFGWEQPVWVHPSVFLKPSGKGKMSKRDTAQLMKDGQSIFITDMADLGYLPEAVVNWIALMGWSYDDQMEFFTMNDLIEKFSIEKLNPSPAAISFSKLDHFNGLHIRNLALDDLTKRLKPFFQKAGYTVDDERLQEITPLLQIRLKTLDEAPEKAGFFFKEEVKPRPDELIGEKMTAVESAMAAQRVFEVLKELLDISPQTIEEPLRNLADELHLQTGQLFGILRVAVTGQKVSTPLFESMAIIGRTNVLKRLQQAVQILETL